MDRAHMSRSVWVVTSWLLLTGLAAALVLAAAAISGTPLPIPVSGGELVIAAGALVAGIAIRAHSRGSTKILLLWSAFTVTFLVLFAPLLIVSAPLPFGVLRYIQPAFIAAAIVTGMVAVLGANMLPGVES